MNRQASDCAAVITNHMENGYGEGCLDSFTDVDVLPRRVKLEKVSHKGEIYTW